MANEITQRCSLNLVNGYISHTPRLRTKQITQTTIGMHNPVVSVGTSEEDFDPGDVTAANVGMFEITNLDTTNYIQWGPKSAGAMVAVGRLKPGESAQLRLEPSVVIRWIANTAAVKVQVTLLQT